MLRRGFLSLYDMLYRRAARPLIFRSGSAQESHERALNVLARLDKSPVLLRDIHRLAFESRQVQVGGVELDHPLILAAGFVKGHGFETESLALAAVQNGENIIPGWRALPLTVGAVEFGSFTRWPRTGNPGVVIWRDAPYRSTQNRVGLKNPGVRAAATFLSQRRANLPPVYGINIAASPGVDDIEQQRVEVLESLAAFRVLGIQPSWFTLNVSCPNTEDDPGGRQTEEQTWTLCRATVDALGERVPLWVKVGPDLAPEQYDILMRVFAETGVRAVIATNTLGQPTPNNPSLTAGVGGARLHLHALAAARRLVEAQRAGGYPVDVIGCGGVQDGWTYQHFSQLGINAVQYWSALVYRGPLAAAIIASEAK